MGLKRERASESAGMEPSDETRRVGPQGTSGNGKGKGGKGDGKGKEKVSFCYGGGQGDKCDDWMTMVWEEAFRGVADAMARTIGHAMQAAYFQGHADGVSDERQRLVGGKGKRESFLGPSAEEGSFFSAHAPDESVASGSQPRRRRADSLAEGDGSRRKARRRDERDRQGGDGGQDEKMIDDGDELGPGVQSDNSLDSETREGLAGRQYG